MGKQGFLLFLSILASFSCGQIPGQLPSQTAFWVRSPGSRVLFNIYFQPFMHWNHIWQCWSLHFLHFGNPSLLYLNRAHWPAELVLGHLLSDVAMPVYMLNFL